MAKDTNIDIAELFNNATTPSRQTSEQPNGTFKLYINGNGDKLVAKHKDLTLDASLLVKITKTAVIFTKDENGNRKQGRKGFGLNKQMAKIFKDLTIKENGKSVYYKLETQEQNGKLYFIASTQAERVDV